MRAVEIEKDAPVSYAATVGGAFVGERKRPGVAGLDCDLVKRGAQTISFLSWRARERLERAL